VFFHCHWLNFMHVVIQIYLLNLFHVCKIWSVHGGDYEAWRLPGCYAMCLLWEPTFRWNLAPSSSGWQESTSRSTLPFISIFIFIPSLFFPYVDLTFFQVFHVNHSCIDTFIILSDVCWSWIEFATDGQSASTSWCHTALWGPWPDFRCSLVWNVRLSSCRTPSLTSRVQVPLYLRPNLTVSFDTGFAFCRRLRLVGIRWRYSNPTTHVAYA
jgi:hypothetical protein